MQNDKVRLETDGKVAVMTLNDPGALNAIGHRMRQDLSAAIEEVERGVAAFREKRPARFTGS